MKNSFIYGFVTMFLFIGCNTDVNKKPIYFGGQIKNPKSDFVAIYKGDDSVTSTKLNKNHKFLFKLDSLDDGLYRFKHGEEYQYLYLQQNDSLLIRLNTWDFDGSLVFSGKGAQRNNFLIQLFLENEQEDRLFYKFFKLNEKDFTLKVDSLIKSKKVQYKQFKENATPQTENFEDLINAIVYFPIYANKEAYPTQYKYYHKLKKLPKLSKGYYAHRQTVEDNPNSFKSYYTYKKYLWNKIYNKSLYEKEKDTLSELSSILLKQISKLVDNEKLKNLMLQQSFINSLFDSSCSNHGRNQNEKIFFNNCNDRSKKEKVSKILKVINTLKKNTKLPEFYLKTKNNKTINSNQLIGENLVIYFWPKEANRIKNMAKRVLYLKKNHPNIQFIGIDGQLNNYDWETAIDINGLNLSNQYQLVEQNKDLFYTNDFPRAIIIDKNGIILSNFTFISHRNFEQNLSVLEK